jgi:hypothetical protein
MKEADVRRQVFRMAHKGLGYWPITQTDASVCPRCRTKVKPPIGRPDILWLHPFTSSRVCEVKILRAGEQSFPFDRITQEQRQWLDRWEADGGLGYLAIGALRPHNSKTYLDHLWLVDWAAWKEVEGLVSPIQLSIPLVASKGMRRELQDNHHDMVTLLEPWRLSRDNGTWQLPPGHSAWPQEVTS